jgi:hypothetical protein
VNTQTNIVWRPVSPTFTIANAVNPTPVLVEIYGDRDGFINASGSTSATASTASTCAMPYPFRW